MDSFFEALVGPQPQLRMSLAVGLLGSLAFGVVGSYVVARRITYIAGAIAHSVLGGIGAVVYLNSTAGTDLDPIWGALASALIAALVIGSVSLYARQREDTVIGAIWALGMTVGILFTCYTPTYNTGLMNYLMGASAVQSLRDLWLVVALDVVVIGTVLLFYNKFLVVCFDEEYARTRGVRAAGWYVLLLCLIALSVVLMVRLVGIIMVIALLTLPAAVAGQFAKRMWQMMALASLCCMAFVTAGLWASWDLGPEKVGLPPGPVIILFAGGAYLLVSLGGRLVHHLRGR